MQNRFAAGDGNCRSACIASILEIDLSPLFEFHAAYMRYSAAARRGVLTEELIDEPAVILARVTGFALWEMPQYQQAPMIPGGWSIANGPTVRGSRHSTVAFDGRIVHDPHPDQAGLEKIEQFLVLVPVAEPVYIEMMEYPMPPRPNRAPS